MSFGHALYYPHIDLRNKNWLKFAFLFWDKISRIVPEGVQPSDDEDIIRILNETNFIDNYSPDPWDVSVTFSSFSHILENLLHNPESYYNSEEMEMIRHTSRRIQHRNALLSNMRLDSNQGDFSYIHMLKMDRRLLDSLISMGFAKEGRENWEGWIKVNSILGLSYMTFLANSISHNNSLPIVTDNETYYSQSNFFKLNRGNRHNNEFEYRLGNLLIANYIPEDINSVTFDQLIKFRKKYDDQRIEFFNQVSELCNSIPSIDNASAMKDALNHYGQLLMKRTEDLKKQYKSSKIDSVCRYVSISIPTMLLNLTDVIPIEYRPVLTGAGIVFSLFKKNINRSNMSRRELESNALSYMLHINKGLPHKEILENYNNEISQFDRLVN
jgi:hypothetical protein